MCSQLESVNKRFNNTLYDLLICKGPYCQTQINNCINNACANNATCVNGINTYICTCPTGYYGQYCQIPLNPCQNNPCSNGICIPSSASASGYYCNCISGKFNIT